MFCCGCVLCDAAFWACFKSDSFAIFGKHLKTYPPLSFYLPVTRSAIAICYTCFFRRGLMRECDVWFLAEMARQLLKKEQNKAKCRRYYQRLKQDPQRYARVKQKKQYPLRREGGYSLTREGGHPLTEEGEHSLTQEGEHPLTREGGHPLTQEGGHQLTREGRLLTPEGEFPLTWEEGQASAQPPSSAQQWCLVHG